GVIEARRRAGRLTVYEINDHVLAPQAWSATAYLARDPLLRSLSLQMAARSHALQFNVTELARVFGYLNPTQAVFENQLWDVPRFSPRADDGARTIWLGWGGSLGHREDLVWALPALRAALDRHPRLGLAIMGPDALRPLFDGFPANRFGFTSGGPLERYYEFLTSLDLGVCPLLPTDFNRCRSDVKFLELASRGVPAICSDLPPYAAVVHGENGLRFTDLADLGRALDRMVDDTGLRARLARNAHATAEARRERVRAPARHAQYEAWQRALGDSPAIETAATSATKSATTGAFGGGSGYRSLSGGALETALREALVHAVAGRPRESLARLAEAERRAPGFYLPALYRGSIEPDPAAGLQALAHAQTLAPDSANVALQQGLRHEALGRDDEARAAYQRCHALLPALGVGAAQLGALAEKAGELAVSVTHFEAAIAANPHYTPPALALAQRALATGDRDRARDILETSLAHDPQFWRTHFLLGRLAGEGGKWATAESHLSRARSDVPPDHKAAVLALLAKAQLAQDRRAAAAATLTELRGLTAGAGP
ncbi:MAG TPA: glycosyltransferase, partial [Polyangia bacterium]